MAYEKPGNPRYSVERTPTGMIFSIPAKKNWFIILFLGFWLMGWAMGEITVLGILGAGIFEFMQGGMDDIVEKGAGAFGGAFLIVWLAGWTVGGAFAIYTWLWQVSGVEQIIISGDSLKIEKKIPVWTRGKNYLIYNISSLRIASSSASMLRKPSGMEFRGISGGLLAFDYGAKTVNFGMGIDEAEAKMILREMGELNPRLVQEQA